MLRDKTVFVLGAAISNEFELPLGWGLKQKILDALPTERGGGHADLREELYKLSTVNEVTNAVRALRLALPIGASIDNVIEHRSDDQLFVEVAKMAIVHCILEGERGSTLFKEDLSDIPELNSSNDSTMSEIFRLIVGSCSKDRIPDAFSEISFVNFNYDRCLEYYLRGALIAYSGFNIQEADKIVRRANIFHPYGYIAPLPAEISAIDTLHYGKKTSRANLKYIAKNIRTFSEERATNEDDQIKTALADATQVIFLGCAFHPQNIRLISPEASWASAVYGTCYVVPPADPNRHATPRLEDFASPTASAFRRAVGYWSHPNGGKSDRFTAFDPLTCRQMLAKYGSDWRADPH